MRTDDAYRCPRPWAFRCNIGFRGKDATNVAIIEATSARKLGSSRSFRSLKASWKDGSWGNGARGWMYVKKSLMQSWRTGSGQINSAPLGALDDMFATGATREDMFV